MQEKLQKLFLSLSRMKKLLSHLESIYHLKPEIVKQPTVSSARIWNLSSISLLSDLKTFKQH